MNFTSIPFPNVIRMPWSGDIVQDIHPELFSQDYCGSVEIEKEVITEVAGYGRQLGALIEAVLALSGRTEELETDRDPLDRLQAIHRKVEAIKAQKRDDLQGHAARALEALRHADAEAYAAFLDRTAKENAAR